MAQPYIGEIRMFGGNFAPLGWMFCSGQLVSIAEYETLFQLIGTTYGGDGQETFALPDLQGRIPIHQGTGQGLSSHVLGETGGVETVTLTTNQIPAHSHPFLATDNPASSTSPIGNVPSKNASLDYYTDDLSGGTTTISPTMLQASGGSQPHNNFQPYLCVNFIISMFGIFPSPT